MPLYHIGDALRQLSIKFIHCDIFYKLYVIIVANIISHHHGNLQNIDNVFNNQAELNRMINYLSQNNANMCNSINLYLFLNITSK